MYAASGVGHEELCAGLDVTGRAAIPLMLRTAPAYGTRGLVVEMTEGTSQANAEFRRNVGFFYDLVKANVERIVKGLTAELENLPVTAVGVTPGWLRSPRGIDKLSCIALEVAPVDVTLR